MSKQNANALREEILRISNVDPLKCMRCGKCSATCPAYDEMNYHPHEFVYMVERGAVEELLDDTSIYRCLSCFACIDRCPRQVEPATRPGITPIAPAITGWSIPPMCSVPFCSGTVPTAAGIAATGAVPPRPLPAAAVPAIISLASTALAAVDPTSAAEGSPPVPAADSPPAPEAADSAAAVAVASPVAAAEVLAEAVEAASADKYKRQKDGCIAAVFFHIRDKQRISMREQTILGV